MALTSELKLKRLKEKMEKQKLLAEAKTQRLKIRAEKALEKQRLVAEKKSKFLKERIVRAKSKKKISMKILRETAQRTTNQIVRTKYPKICFTCDDDIAESGGIAAVGHFWEKREYTAVRYHFDNLRIQCTTCNRFKSGNLAEYSVRLRAELGEEVFGKLNIEAHQEKKWTREELEQLIEERKKILSQANAN